MMNEMKIKHQSLWGHVGSYAWFSDPIKDGERRSRMPPKTWSPSSGVMTAMQRKSGLLVAQVWQRLDDVIMGGQSSSGLQISSQGATAVWSGELITEGGGFCGARTASRDWDLGGAAGIRLRVRGDGQTYKLNLKTVRRGLHGTELQRMESRMI